MSIARNTLKQVLLDNQKDVEQYDIFRLSPKSQL